ncbi:hypothetical protein [Sphingobium sp. BS19]|uniref:hypothetical protein n=1 Tax=Sphingobium sp. BS19 TaxID=3018973 RepID=UPI0022EFBC70|nr:hypothetical protein [Sphingobium sp. BS19]GLI98132.1 hypothetical protein Sbs19_19500 [Sphingobium sp. BS19]
MPYRRFALSLSVAALTGLAFPSAVFARSDIMFVAMCGGGFAPVPQPRNKGPHNDPCAMACHAIGTRKKTSRLNQ